MEYKSPVEVLAEVAKSIYPGIEITGARPIPIAGHAEVSAMFCLLITAMGGIPDIKHRVRARITLGEEVKEFQFDVDGALLDRRGYLAIEKQIMSGLSDAGITLNNTTS